MTRFVKVVFQNSVSVSLLEKICRVLDCDYGDIMEYVPDEPKEKNK
ncbi:MAG: helix-turn-helix transcriptional regulator [Clostridiales bacterium]|jgi:DNA-binding Xre family transcriptional regulator|nr:helix-turn-helix transcriptional regulator [Clostridiales bacterium]